METFSRETHQPEPLAPEWVTGFADGEASFTYSRSSTQIALYFAVKLTAAEEPLLQRLQAFFGGGTIYHVQPRAPRERSGATKTASYFRISRHDELPAVVAHFDRYPLRSTKKQVYELWRMMVLAKQQFRKPDRELLERLAEVITSLCVRKQSWR